MLKDLAQKQKVKEEKYILSYKKLMIKFLPEKGLLFIANVGKSMLLAESQKMQMLGQFLI